MPAGSASSLEALRPAIKARWENLLRESPVRPLPAATIVKPEMLVFMLDDTLTRLAARLHRPHEAGRLRRDPAPFDAQHAGCPCGLNLLVDYYLAGARALTEVLPAELGPVRLEMLHYFTRLAHDELSALCGICRHHGRASCQLPPETAEVSPPGAAAWPATRSATGRSRAGTPG